MSSGGIFNVPEPTGAELAKQQTTAATAQVEAKTSEAARAIEKNADQAQHVAGDAANAAKSLGKEFTGEPTTTIDRLQSQAKQTTNAAVIEGQHDVQEAKATGQAYLDQAKSVAASAAATVSATVQPYLPGSDTSSTGTTRSAPTGNQPGVAAQLQSGAAVALQTGKEYLAAAQQAAQPYVEKATTAAQNYLGNVQEQGSTTTGAPQASGTVPASSAPLESGGQTVGGPYASNAGAKVGEVSNKV